MKYLNTIAEKIYNKPLGITQNALESLQIRLKEVSCMPMDLDDCEEEPYSIIGSVAVINIEGVILNDCNPLEKLLGCLSLADLREDLKELSNNEIVKTVILNFASGGGMVAGIEETKQAIEDLKKTKAVYSFVGGGNICASSAFHLAVMANAILVSTSAEIGNVGCYVVFNDISKMLSDAGVSIEVFKGGSEEESTYKAAGITGSLTDAQKAYIKEGVDKAYKTFCDTVKANRKGIKDDTLTGKFYEGQEAVDVGFADYTLTDLDILIDYLNQ